MRKLAYLIVASLLIGCGGGGGGGGGSTTAPAKNPEAVTAIAIQAGSPVIPGFDLQFKQGDWWLYNYESRHTTHMTNPITGYPDYDTTTKTGTARITLGSTKTILGIPFFEVIKQYTGDVGTSYYIEWQYVASFNNKIYGYKDGQVFLIFDAQNGAWVGGTFFGGITLEGLDKRIYSVGGVAAAGKYSVQYPWSRYDHGWEEYFVQGVGPSGYYEHDSYYPSNNPYLPEIPWSSTSSYKFTLVDTSTNSAPIARIVANTTFDTGTPITLDGTSSTDAENNPLTFTWSITSKPTAATASLSDVHASKPILTSDSAGAYQITLIVNDGITTSVPTSTFLTAVSSEARLKVELLKGYWTFNYTIINTWTNHYKLDNIVESTGAAGDYKIYGKGDYGDIVVAGYSSTENCWNLLDTGSNIDTYFIFYTDGSLILPGSCYYQISHPSETWSSCYPLSGYKSSISTTLSRSLVSKQALEPNLRDEVLKFSTPPPEVHQQYINFKQQYDGK